MALLNLSLPAIGEASATADQKVRDGLNSIQTTVNGNLDAANLSASTTLAAVGAFSAYRAAALNIGTGTVITFDTEEFDVSGWFDTVTNIGRYTPLMAGYYRLSAQLETAGGAVDTYLRTTLRKNGTPIKYGPLAYQRGSGMTSGLSVAAYANGTTDYFDVSLSTTAGSVALSNGSLGSWFNGELIGK